MTSTVGNQVYHSNLKPGTGASTPNIYVGDLCRPSQFGAAGTASLYRLQLSEVPALSTTINDVLLRHTVTGVVERIPATDFLATGGSTQRSVAGVGQIIAAGVSTTVDFGTSIVADPGLSYAAGVFTVVTGGLFTFSAVGVYEPLGAGQRYLFFNVSTAGILRVANSTDNSTIPQPNATTISWTGFLNAGDTLSCGTFQTSGGPLILQGPAFDTANVTRIGVTRVTLP
jgi:hypothetical protein